MAYGTLVTLDTLAATQQSVIEIGEDNIWAALDAYLAAHNRLLREKVSTLVEFTTERLKRFGGIDVVNMEPLDEMGTPEPEKIVTGQTLGFPLRKFGKALQWTRHYFRNATGEELAKQVQAIRDADIRNIDREIKRAFFRATNFTFTDRLVDGVSLPVKALINADSSSIDPDVNGNTFDGSTHTHFIANAGLTAGKINEVISTVVEHYATGRVFLWINSAQEAAVRALNGTNEFIAYQPVQVLAPTDTLRATGTLTTSPGLLYNRAIGVWGQNAAEVWVKPWIPANYLVAWMDGVRKPLTWRARRAGLDNLELEADDEVHPLRARAWGREFGIGVTERTAAAILYIGGGAYVVPTFS